MAYLCQRDISGSLPPLQRILRPLPRSHLEVSFCGSYGPNASATRFLASFGTLGRLLGWAFDNTGWSRGVGDVIKNVDPFYPGFSLIDLIYHVYKKLP